MKKLLIILMGLFCFTTTNVLADEVISNIPEDGIIKLKYGESIKLDLIDTDNYSIVNGNYPNLIEIRSDSVNVIASDYGIYNIYINYCGLVDGYLDYANEHVINFVLEVEPKKYLDGIVDAIPDTIYGNNDMSSMVSNYFYEKGINNINVKYDYNSCSEYSNKRTCNYSIGFSYWKDDQYVEYPYTINKKITTVFNQFGRFYINYLDLNSDIAKNFNLSEYITLYKNVSNHDLTFFSSDSNIIEVNPFTGKSNVKKVGKVKIGLYDATLKEGIEGEINVELNNSSMDKEEAKNVIGDIIDDLPNGIFVNVKDYYNYIDSEESINYSGLIEQYISDTFYSEIYSSIGIRISNFTSDNNGNCTFDFSYSFDWNNYSEDKTITTNVKLYGVAFKYGKNEFSSVGSFITISPISFLDNKDDFDLIIDNEFLSKDEFSSNTYKVLKMGKTIVKIVSKDGKYSDVKYIEIKESYEVYNNFMNKFKNQNFDFPYSLNDFKNTDYINLFLKYEFKKQMKEAGLTDYDVTFNYLFGNQAKVTVNSDNGTSFSKIIEINFAEVGNSNLVDEINKVKNSFETNYQLSEEESFKYANLNYGDDFYKLLVNKISLKYTPSSRVDVSYEFANIIEYDGISVGATYNLILSVDGITVDIIPFNVYVDLVISSDISENVENVIHDYLLSNYNLEYTVNHVKNNIYKLTIGDKSFNVLYKKVENIDITSISINQSIYSLNVGEKVSIEYAMKPINSNSDNIKFVSGNKNIATVDSNGVVTAVSEGETFIRVYSKNYGLTVKVLVGKTILEFLNNAVDKIGTNVDIYYSELEYSDSYENAIRNKISNVFWNYYGYFNGLSIKVESKDNEYYYTLSMNGETSKESRISYKLKGIKLEEKNVSLNVGDTYKINGTYSEGKFSDLIVDYDSTKISFNDFVVKGLEPGIARIYLCDKNYDHCEGITFKVSVNEYVKELKLKLQNKTIEFTVSNYGYSDDMLEDFERNFLWRIEEQIEDWNISNMFDNNSYTSTCDFDNNKCSLSGNVNGEPFSITLDVIIKGIKIQNSIIELNTTQVVPIEFETYNLSNPVKIESYDKDICSISSDNKVTGLKTGICKVLLKSDSYAAEIIVVVNKDDLQKSFDDEINNIDDTIYIDLDEFDADNAEYYQTKAEEEDYYGNPYEEEYEAIILKYIKDRISYDNYVEYDITELRQNNKELLVTARFDYNSYVKDGKYEYDFYYNDLEPNEKTFNIIYRGFKNEYNALREKVKSNLKSKYTLTLEQLLRYEMSDESYYGIGLYAFADLDKIVKDACEDNNCTYFFVPYGGAGDEGWVMESGLISVYKDGYPIYSRSIDVVAEFNITVEENLTRSEVLDVIAEDVKDVYIDIKSGKSINGVMNKYNNKAIILNKASDDDIEVKVVPKYTEDGQIYYNIDVDNLNFDTKINILYKEGTSEEPPVIPEEPSKPIESISLNSDNINLTKGGSYSLVATINPSDTTDVKAIIWVSSNTNVATVDQNGNVKAIGGGTAIITATTSNGLVSIANVFVNSPITSVSLSKTKLSLELKKTYNLKAIINPSDTTDNKKLTWSSSNKNIVTVDSNGKITAKKIGTAVITVKTTNGKIAKCTVTVTKVKATSITYPTIKNQVYTGKQIKPGVTLKYAGTTLKLNTDYTLTYGTNKSTGIGTIKVTYKGNYTGTYTIKFKIVPKKVAIVTPTSTKGKVTVKWKKAVGVSGYQIIYRIKGTSKWTYAYATSTSTSKAISKLVSNKNYEIRIRGYKTISNVKEFGAWSDLKTIKCK